MPRTAPGQQNPLQHLVFETMAMKKQAIVFVNSKRSAEKSAEDIAKKIKEGSSDLDAISYQALNALSTPTKQCERLSYCMKKGIAFHHAGLSQKQKDLIEDQFREGKVHIICATPTISMGVDLPAFRTILKDVRRFSGPRGLTWIPNLEYNQMAGRAGRPSFDKYGEAIVIAGTEEEKSEIFERYVFGEPEEIYSKLAVEPVLRTYLLSLISTEFVSTKEEILKFFEKTFWAHQFQDMARLEQIISKVLGLLEEFEFIRTPGKGDDFVTAAQMVEGKITATVLGKRVAQLYIDPLSAHELILALQKAPNKNVKEFSYLHMVCARLEMRPLLRVKTREWEFIQESFAKFTDTVLDLEPSLYDGDYDEYMNSVKTALFFEGWINEKDENALLKEFDIRPGEVHAKIAIADWLLYSAEEIAKLMKFHNQVKGIMKTRYRLKYGVKEELLPLLKLKGVGRVRARKMFSNGIKDLGDVKKVDISTLVQLLGKQIAINVKSEVGIDIQKESVADARKTGQVSLMDF